MYKRQTVKGGKFLEAMAEADTIVFDKTGTLTKACPTVASVVSFCDKTSDELLRIAACLEEHFPHSMAKAVVDAATQKNLLHEEMHTKPEDVYKRQRLRLCCLILFFNMKSPRLSISVREIVWP